MKEKELNSRNILLPYAITLIIMVTILQIFNYSRGPVQDVVSMAELSIVAIYYYWFNWKNKNKLKKIRFGYLVSHFITYVIVNLSYSILSFIVFAKSTVTIIGDGSIIIPTDWSGALLYMPIFWGIGLIIHALASISNRGFEEK